MNAFKLDQTAHGVQIWLKFSNNIFIRDFINNWNKNKKNETKLI